MRLIILFLLAFALPVYGIQVDLIPVTNGTQWFNESHAGTSADEDDLTHTCQEDRVNPLNGLPGHGFHLKTVEARCNSVAGQSNAASVVGQSTNLVNSPTVPFAEARSVWALAANSGGANPPSRAAFAFAGGGSHCHAIFKVSDIDACTRVRVDVRGNLVFTSTLSSLHWGVLGELTLRAGIGTSYLEATFDRTNHRWIVEGWTQVGPFGLQPYNQTFNGDNLNLTVPVFEIKTLGPPNSLLCESTPFLIYGTVEDSSGSIASSNFPVTGVFPSETYNVDIKAKAVITSVDSPF